VHAPRRVAFINEKGGSAKTTLASNLAAYLALHRGRRILAIDLDPQGQLGKVLGVDGRSARRSAIDLVLDAALGDEGLDRVRADAERAAVDPAATLPISRTRIDRLDLVPANKSLGLLPGWEDGAFAEASGRLAATLDAEAGLRRYDFVFFDGPPSFGPLTLCALRAASEVVLPVPLTYLALDGCAELVRTLTLVRNRYDHPALEISMVVPTFYRRTRLAHEVLERLKARFPKEIAHTVVGFHVKIDEAQSRGLSIFEYAPRDRGASAMARLAEELEIRGNAGRREEP
jgi:chromosome partitioning protein